MSGVYALVITCALCLAVAAQIAEMHHVTLGKALLMVVIAVIANLLFFGGAVWLQRYLETG